MLKTISAYLDLFSRAIIVSRHLNASPDMLDDVRRLSIITYLGETALTAPKTDAAANAAGKTFVLPHAA